MLSTESVPDLLTELNKATIANNIYIALDQSNSVTKDQYTLQKLCAIRFAKLLCSLKPSFFKTSVIHYDATATQVITPQTTFPPIENGIKALNQASGAVNFGNALTTIKTLADPLQGRKVVFLFTTGQGINQNNVLEITSSSNIEIVCFLILQNGTAKQNELSPIFGGNQRVILLPDQQTAQNYFDNLIVTGSEVPQISIKKIYSSSATLNIQGIENYQSIKALIKTSTSPSPSQTNYQNCKEITVNLRADAPRQIITVQGIKPNLQSAVSNEFVLHLPKIHPITKRIRNSNTSQQLRNYILQFQIPEPLRRAGIENFNISIMGDMGNGKSSFINVVLTAMQAAEIERICSNAPTGTGELTLTRDIKRYCVTRNLNIIDRYGTQFNDDHSELENFIKGRLLPGFIQGGKQNQENPRFKSEASLKNALHLIIYIVDLKSAENDDSIKKFGEITQYLKQEHSIPVLVGLTKLDKLQEMESGNLALDESELGEALENENVKKFIQKYAKKAEISENDILPIFNYTGPFEERSQVKDVFGLVLLDTAIQRIAEYFQRYIVLDLVDQNEKTHGSLLLEVLEVSLEYFSQHYFKKISNTESFKPVGFFSRENKIIPEEKWANTYLNDIEFNQTIKDGFQIYTLRVQNDKACEKS